MALHEAQQPEFKDYAHQVLKNAKELAETLMEQGGKLVTGGTDNHLMLMDTASSLGVGGKEAEATLDKIAITVNKQVIPDDPNPPLSPSGIRIGTPAATTRGMKEPEMRMLGQWIIQALKSKDDAAGLERIRKEASGMCREFPVPAIG